ncbi:fibronectin type III domain-containing protein [Desulfonatronovibrio magnus]|uniref:fibronectin type III domain-containing protein n=1 Tax=Desulfonatronovibrio magnus TaxID=698827 RepID=UPI0005EBC58E|nr:fibronectin type III domain-containing protein [Desulfonatronovibrio magnus]
MKKIIEQTRVSVLLYAFFSLAFIAAVLLPGPCLGEPRAMSVDLPVIMSADGNTLYNAGKPVALIADPNPDRVRISIPAREKSSIELSAMASFQITYLAEGEEDLWGEPCYDFPDNARTALDRAAEIWGTLISSDVPITIRACWFRDEGDTLGYAGGQPRHRNFSGAPKPDTWYVGALANSMAGTDLAPSEHDMHIAMNSNFDWYLGTDGNPPSYEHDFVTIMLHEIAHGLGFTGSVSYSSQDGTAGWGFGTDNPRIYDTFMRDGNGKRLTDTSVYPNPSAGLADLVTSGNLWWHGSHAMSANGGQRVMMYAPAAWSSGSSYSHLDYDTFRGTENRLMVYAASAGDGNHNPGPVTMGILKDMGWNTGKDQKPGKATQISPSGTISTSQPTYAWRTVSDATYYHLWANDSTGNRINRWYTSEDANCTAGGNCSLKPSVTLASGSGSWWVRTYNDAGFGPWSNGLDFRVDTGESPPGKATQISPKGTISTSQPTYTWRTVSDAAYYHLWANDSTGNRINRWYTSEDANCTAGGNCSVKPSVTLAAGSGSWWVRTWNSAGYGLWSNGLDFRVDTGESPPGKATQISPKGTISTSQPTYTWRTVSDATYYHLWANDSTGNRINRWYTSEDANCTAGGNCSLKPSVTLASGSGSWWVRTYNDAGFGPWSDGLDFRVGTGDTSAPVLLSPENGSRLDSIAPLFRWYTDDASSGEWLILELAEDREFERMVTSLYTSKISGEDEFRFALNLDPDRTYWWRARVEIGEEEYGPYSESWSFTTSTGGILPSSPRLTSPADGSKVHSWPVRLEWSSVAGAEEYAVFISEDDESGSHMLNYTEETYHEPFLLEPNTKYKWWIQARNEYGFSEPSATWYFTTPATSSSKEATHIERLRFTLKKDDTLITVIE